MGARQIVARKRGRRKWSPATLSGDRWVGENGGGEMIDDGNVCEGVGWRTGGGTG